MPFLLIQYPSGHRANIEIQPNTTLRKALELACEKRLLDPAQHTLTHNRRPVDLSVIFRLSGLVNRASLDLVPLSNEDIHNATATSTEVRVCFRLDDGERALWQGDSAITLWSILQEISGTNSQFAKFLQPDDGLVPSVAYLGEQVIGEANLRSKRLLDLGVSSGSVLLQLHRRPPAQQEAVIGVAEQSSPADQSMPSVPVGNVESKRPRTTCSSATAMQPSYSEPVDVHGSEKLAGSSDVGGGGAVRMETECTDPTFVPPWSVFAEPPRTSMFGQSRDETTLPVPRENETLGSLLGIDLAPDRGSLPAWNTEPPANSSYVFSDFSFPAQTEGMDTRNEDVAADGSSDQKEVDRECVVFRRPTKSTNSQSSLDDLPDEVFEHTEADLRSLIQACRNVWNSDEPLKTAAMRAAARQKLYKKYRRAVIQFHWSDGIVVQACFSPHEDLAALYGFVEELLLHSSTKFSLYTTPPKITLKRTSTNLVEAGLVPLAKVYFSAMCSKAEEVLSPSVLDNLKLDQKPKADEVVRFWMNPNSLKLDAQ